MASPWERDYSTRTFTVKACLITSARVCILTDLACRLEYNHLVAIINQENRSVHKPMLNLLRGQVGEFYRDHYKHSRTRK